MIRCLWAASESINSHVGVAVPHQRHLVQTVMKGGVITSLLLSRIHINWGLLDLTVLLLRRVKGLSMLRLLVLVVNGAVIEH